MRYYYPIFGCFLIFIVWLTYELRKSRRKMNEQTSSFWEKEAAANLTRRVSPDSLPYIQIPLDRFPIGKYQDSVLSTCESTLQSLSTKKILNLTGKTSTELKAEYGPANLSLLDECDMNYTELVKTIASYGSRLHELNHDQESITVLEFGIAILTDICSNYKLLAMLYAKQGEHDKIEGLIQTAEQLDSLMKHHIIESLKSTLISHTEK